MFDYVTYTKWDQDHGLYCVSCYYSTIRTKLYFSNQNQANLFRLNHPRWETLTND